MVLDYNFWRNFRNNIIVFIGFMGSFCCYVRANAQSQACAKGPESP